MLKLLSLLLSLTAGSFTHSTFAQTPEKCVSFLKVTYTNHDGRVAQLGYILDKNQVPSHLCFVDPDAPLQGEKFKVYSLSDLREPQTFKGDGSRVAAQLQYVGCTLTLWYQTSALSGHLPDKSRAFVINPEKDGYEVVDSVTAKPVHELVIEPTLKRIIWLREVGIKSLTVK